MPTIELSAKSLDEGRKQAAEKLGVAPDAVELKVIEETKGLFGRTTLKLSASAADAAPAAPTAKPARATKSAKAAPAAEVSSEDVPAEAEEAEKPKLARGRARKTVESVAAAEPEARSEEKTLETAPAEVKTGSAPRRLGKKSETAVAPVAAPAPVDAAAPTSAPAPAAGAPRRLGRKTEAEAPAAPAKEARAPRAERAAKPAERTEAEEDALEATEEHAERFQREIESLLQKSGLDIEVTAGGVEGKYVNLQIGGKDAAHLIGRSGEVLNSLQYLMNLVGKQQHNDGIRVTLDANDYRTRREEALAKMAHDIAAQVLDKGMEALLPPLPAFERRVVHRIASEIPGIQTYSEGEEPNRQIVIAPAD